MSHAANAYQQFQIAVRYHDFVMSFAVCSWYNGQIDNMGAKPMIATTYGTGPFNAAIRFQHELYVNPHEYETETEALNAAMILHAQMIGSALNSLGDARFNWQREIY